MSEQIGAVLVFVGLFLATSGLLVFIGRSLRVLLGRTERRRLLGPAALLVAGLVIGAVPFAAQHLYLSIVGLAERERVVNGRPALVLTGWDRSDYSILATKPGTEILEMGNADVTDATLDLFAGLPKLRELTLNDTRITDAGLVKLLTLKQLESLRIARTAVTPEGVAAFLADAPPPFREIDVTGNNIPTSILRKWKNAAATIGEAPSGEAKAALPERRYVN
ncbi:MAG: hypothetical protein NT171_19230 [Planctomycetota bacterium]|nr:hypothetical protein [Planctomycetota bacterium]